ncbi:MAG: hypothetical protein E3J90_12755 [Promethearchaeota archaeon]|nr:MAG: hypothetical protein E3J90_12755 [Candidatus Lokiarchaeota archaeon]
MIHISRYINYLKTSIIYIALGITLILYFYNQVVGIFLASLVFVVYLASFLISLSSKRSLLKIVQKYSTINDKEISNKLDRPLDDIRNTLFSLSKNQKNKKWLIVFLNQRYIFLNESAVESFKQLYHMGYNEKKILEHLQQNTRIKSRAVVKAIELTLVKQNRLKINNE